MAMGRSSFYIFDRNQITRNRVFVLQAVGESSGVRLLISNFSSLFLLPRPAKIRADSKGLASPLCQRKLNPDAVTFSTEVLLLFVFTFKFITSWNHQVSNLGASFCGLKVWLRVEVYHPSKVW